MPLYDIEYVTPLTLEQQEQPAIAFTDEHSQRFNTPRFFINVRYTDVSNQVVFRGGPGSNRTKEVYLDHCKQIVTHWERIIGCEDEEGLRTVWVMGALTTALEAGIGRPKTGEENQWIGDNMQNIQALAAAGDEDFVELLHELEEKKQGAI
ncbi:hypothetical protein M440DRAFT_1436348 [Trichoderma longibrachiatum ATCC 18648]|uniref:Tautomerase cis-CaaD-like domain-containing protein n=1 Tax=Trichoderma longibrachiatum ATCC 18648 TaxID=983965 RepID=A0A2T4CBI9_TRILO|nr:hypothetical protein M440DRAFT_1436348 [Trichoderma longibrachiatum ATCC 18648]